MQTEDAMGSAPFFEEQDASQFDDPPQASSAPNLEPEPIYVPPSIPFEDAPVSPPGRRYVMMRQPPSFQHASLAGMPTGATQMTTLIAGALQVLAGGAAGYLATHSIRSAAGIGLTVLGAGQLPHVLEEGGIKRLGLGAAALAGAYFLLRDAPGMRAVANETSQWLRARE